MESFRTFFNRIKRIEPKFDLPGHFSTGIYYDIYEEGLIHSYDIEKVKQKISTLENFVEIYLEDPTSFVVIFDISDQEFDQQMNILDNILKVYGYYVTKMNGRVPNKGISFTIEKKVPDKVDPSTNKNGKYYHITHSNYVDKIMSKGISPRESSTIFRHPGGRIYLIQTNNKHVISILAKSLFNSKLKKLGSKSAETDSKDDVNRFLTFARGNMVRIEVDISGLELYYDPMVDRDDDNYRAVFTNDFISPNRLKEPVKITFI